jgi:hypothetical protein
VIDLGTTSTVIGNSSVMSEATSGVTGSPFVLIYHLKHVKDWLVERSPMRTIQP